MALFSLHTHFRTELRSNLQSVLYNKRWLLHIIIWIVLIIIIQASGEQSFGTPLSAYFLMLTFATAGFTYTFLLYLVPYSHHRKSIWVLLLGTPVNIILWWAILFKARAVYYHAHPGNIPDVFKASPGLILGYSVGQMLIFTWGFFAFYYFIDLYNQQKSLDRYQDVLAEKLKAELAFLQQQINPHFLFNTLNNIYLLALKDSDEAPVVIRRLRSLLNYMLNDCTLEKVPLSSEVDFLKNYISLEQLRIQKGTATITTDISGDMGGKEIPPLLLINFVENAFKHGVKGGISRAEITIKVHVSSNELNFNVTNRKQLLHNSGHSVPTVGGIGLTNVRRRLQILYPGQDNALAITETSDTYSVQLTLQLS